MVVEKKFIFQHTIAITNRSSSQSFYHLWGPQDGLQNDQQACGRGDAHKYDGWVSFKDEGWSRPSGGIPRATPLICTYAYCIRRKRVALRRKPTMLVFHIAAAAPWSFMRSTDQHSFLISEILFNIGKKSFALSINFLFGTDEMSWNVLLLSILVVQLSLDTFPTADQHLWDWWTKNKQADDDTCPDTCHVYLHVYCKSSLINRKNSNQALPHLMRIRM